MPQAAPRKRPQQVGDITVVMPTQVLAWMLERGSGFAGPRRRGGGGSHERGVSH